MNQNGSEVTVSITIVTRDRSADVAALINGLKRQSNSNFEILVGDNGSKPTELEKLQTEVGKHTNATLYRFGENLGVSGGRNELLRRCRGPLIVELDDDIAAPKESLIEDVCLIFRNNPKLGIAAFKIRNYHSGQVDRHEFPFLDKRRDPDSEGEAAWFIGCGHCFRRDMLNDVGLYRDFAPYGMEEFDLSYRALDKEWGIRYFPSIEIFHKRSPVHRITDTEEYGALALAQRTKAALLNLPMPMCVSQFLIRGFMYSKWGRYPSVFKKAGAELWRVKAYIRQERRPIKFKTVIKLLRLRGPLFF